MTLTAWYLAGMRDAILPARRRAVGLCALGMAMGIAVCAAWGQSAPPTEMPKDPVALLNLAANSNGLGGTGMKPWRLKASFEALDEQGAVSEQGTIEEDWAGEHQSKTTYTVGADSETDYDSDKGMLRTVTGKPSVGQAINAMAQLIHPIPDEQTRSHWTVVMEKRDAGKLKVDCIAVKAFKSPSGDHEISGPMFCLDADKPSLRASVQPFGGFQVLFNGIRSFEDRYVAGEITEVRNGKKVLAVHLLSLEPIPAVDAAEFIPPADATPVERKIAISSAVAQGNLVKAVAPDYPIYAKEAGISGTVVLQGQIGKDGLVTNVRAISGPEQLRQAAVDAVKRWVYHPYLLNGEPVSVDTTINVVFNLGRR
jgi:TonB family protein